MTFYQILCLTTGLQNSGHFDSFLELLWNNSSIPQVADIQKLCLIENNNKIFLEHSRGPPTAQFLDMEEVVFHDFFCTILIIYTLWYTPQSPTALQDGILEKWPILCSVHLGHDVPNCGRVGCPIPNYSHCPVFSLFLITK